MGKWIMKLWDVYIPLEYSSAMRKKGILPFVTTWMDLTRIMLSEIIQRQKDTGTPKFRAALLTRTPTSLHLKYPRKEKNG